MQGRLGILGALAVTLAAGEVRAPELDAVAQRWATVQTMEGVFTRVVIRPDEPDTPPVTYQGTLAVAVPNRFDLVLRNSERPEWAQRQVSDGRWYIQVERIAEGQEDIRRRAVGEDDADLRRLLACLRLDIPVLERDFIVALAPRDDGPGRQLTLTPASDDMRRWVARIVIQLDAEDRPQRVITSDVDGMQATVTVERAVYDQPIAPERFTLPE